jgi:plasmid maintenance system antidote protein VapI
VTRISASLWLNLQRAVDLHRARAALAETLPLLSPITREREFINFGGEPEIEKIE